MFSCLHWEGFFSSPDKDLAIAMFSFISPVQQRLKDFSFGPDLRTHFAENEPALSYEILLLTGGTMAPTSAMLLGLLLCVSLHAASASRALLQSSPNTTLTGLVGGTSALVSINGVSSLSLS